MLFGVADDQFERFTHLIIILIKNAEQRHTTILQAVSIQLSTLYVFSVVVFDIIDYN